ncbi:DUF2442 domain-containing protein [Larkinella sp. VNQ87]|uniref:DUF2442 domain-containing protein n=1 Tax=Larkinella sp. VNQ87 TaxID=3400921 RepID=UPI003C0F8D1E
MKTDGFTKEQPVLDRISFRKEGYLSLLLKDGRILSVPLSRFPGIERLTTTQRRKYHIADGVMLLFDGDDEVYHIQDFLGMHVLPSSSVGIKSVVQERAA